MSDGCLSTDLGGSRGDSSSYPLEDLGPDEFGCPVLDLVFEGGGGHVEMCDVMKGGVRYVRRW